VCRPVALRDGVVGELQGVGGGVERLGRIAIRAGGARGGNGALRLIHFLVRGSAAGRGEK
jgi:hypothetical protein